MLHEDQVKSWTLTVLKELLVQLVEDGLRPPLHADVFDDQVGASPGRIASFELDAKGNVAWWAWRSPDACARAAWPLKLRCEFGEGEHRTVWLRSNSWNLDKADLRRRVVRM
jgi:hypothetical protein